MDKIRKTIKTRGRLALAVPRGDGNGDVRELIEVAVSTYTNPRNENAWKRIGQAFCDRHDLDFVRFTGEPIVIADVYEMDIMDFLLNATLVEPKKETEE